ncbi:hypothetical protein BpHYR1_038864 [Brachionus plicatilis]|uniref:Uncharacterized protein n=1 Tax=Brachionus plicatilis TaxID=10195 RepID=A0A3M7RQZ6_BRAPC|nr:hypothetical protein BpHYR1_038864 [Brachionus plicatilis]
MALDNPAKFSTGLEINIQNSQKKKKNSIIYRYDKLLSIKNQKTIEKKIYYILNYLIGPAMLPYFVNNFCPYKNQLFQWSEQWDECKFATTRC